MEIVTVTLPKQYYASWTLDWKKFTSLFPDSLISTTVELTNDTHIEFTQPFMTIEVMNLLEEIVRTQTVPHSKVKGDQLEHVGRYLGIDLFNVMAHPHWESFRTSWNILDPEDVKKHGPWFMELAICGNYLALVSYLLDRGIDPTEIILDNMNVLAFAADRGYYAIVKRFLQDGRIDPNLAYLVIVAR